MIPDNKVIKCSPIRRSNRTTFFVYHPDHNYNDNYEDVKKKLKEDLKLAKEVAEIYVEETNSSQVYSKQVLKDIESLFKDIDKNYRDVYLLEAFAEFLFPDSITDKNRKYHKVLPTFKELQSRALEIKAEDSGILYKSGIKFQKPIQNIKL